MDQSHKRNGLDAQIKTKIAEKGINKTVLGKNYANVIHTVAEIQFKINGEYKTQLTNDFYIAKGVGLIALSSKTTTKEILKTELITYNIK